jgi:outer membrane receptor protein involved in Fe transport
MKKVIFNFIVLIVLIVFQNIPAQSPPNRSEAGNVSIKGNISGKILDTQTKQPIEYGNIVLLNFRDSSLVNGTVSNNAGSFMLDNISPGRYIVKVSYIGYSPKILDSIFVSSQNLVVNLGTIELAGTYLDIGEVVVSSEKEMIINNLDKKVINVEKDLTSVGGTALDVMQNIPSVTVDADGTVSVRGNSNVTILVDGKPSGLTSISSSDVLTAIPSSSIESIELITNPSARYDPEGTAGILNVVLKRKSNLGLNGMFSLNAGTGNKYNSSLNMNYKLDDLNLFTSYDGRFNNFKSLSLSSRTSSFDNLTSYLNQNSDMTNQMNIHNLNLGADYYLNDQNLVTLSFQYRQFSMDNEGNMYTQNFDSDYSLQNYFSRQSDALRKVKSYSYNLSYRKTYDEKNHELTADILYRDNAMNRDENSLQQSMLSDDIQNSTDPFSQRSIGRNTNKMLIVQSNYIHPLSDVSRVETGFRSTIKNLIMNSDYENYDYPTSSWALNPLLVNHFNFDEQIHAVYGIYTGSVESFKYQAGIRAEQVLTNARLESADESFDNDYFSVYPSVHLGYDFAPGEELLLSYSRRVDRPRHREINPFVDYSDTLNISRGNPALKPQFINSYELGYTNTFDKTTIVSSLFYKQTSGMITSISRLEENGVTQTTFENIADGISYGVELIAAQPLFPWWRLNANFSYFRTIIEDASSGINISNDSYSWLARLNSNFNIVKDFSIQLVANYNAPTITVQGKLKELYNADIAMKKDFLDGKLSLNLRISDIFNTMKYSSETYGTGFFIDSERKRDTRTAYIGITYRLDNNGQQKEKTRNRDSEDDMMDF